MYNTAREKLCTFLHAKGASPDEAERYQHTRDEELKKTYGYSACRFARSFEDTVLHLYQSASTDDIRYARSLALEVFETKATPVDGLQQLLAALRQHYMLGILTAGERWVQDKRLREFPFINDFQATEIVASKTAKILRNFCDNHRVRPEKSWVVGDSVSSDIRPALEAGFQAVHLRVENWSQGEGVGTINGVPQISQLSDLLRVPGLLPE